MRVDQWWTVGPYRFEQLVNHPFNKITSGPMYRFAIDGKIGIEMFESLDRAMVAAVGERAMGPRGAGGNAVGTAADWFCIMIGLNEVEAKQRPAVEQPAVKQESDCQGSGRGWGSTTDDAGVIPICLFCLKTPEELGVGRPPAEGDDWNFQGLVPEHAS